MNYPSIRLEGAILSPDILDRLEDAPGQRPADFGLEGTARVKDEIARAWADAQDYWRIFQRKLETLRADSPATTETRQQWMVPLLGLLGYQLEYQARGVELNGKTYAISHRVTNRGNTPLHIIGYREPAGLDRKPEKVVLRMSAHAMMQEYLNLQDELYGLVTNGRVVRLLRDSSRLVKLTYLEFDLDRIFTDGLFADFAVCYRLLHASRLPQTVDAASTCWLERYHQDSLEQGTRIREGLRLAVTEALEILGTGFLAHPDNAALHEQVAQGELRPDIYFNHLLRLVYRLLFLMVTEERGLVFARETPRQTLQLYYDHYSVQRLRRLAVTRGLKVERFHDAWFSLLATFQLFEHPETAAKLGATALGGQIFHPQALGLLRHCRLSNAAFLSALERLCYFTHPKSGQRLPVNFGALATEEFGSVYESLLELHPFIDTAPTPCFGFRHAAGNERKTSGSYYTPASLVDCLLDSALDPVLDERIRNYRVLGYPDAEAAVLALKVCDPACGSGHFLIAAAQRIARRLATLRAGGEEPGPELLRHSLREVIGHCIHGVDINPMAVELCKVGLWLEAVEPGKPLTFLDHHIKCGNSLLGATPDDIREGIPDKAYEPLTGDTKEAVRWMKKLNQEARSGQGHFDFSQAMPWERLGNLPAAMAGLETLDDDTPEALARKEMRYREIVEGSGYESARLLHDTWCAAFVWPKNSTNYGTELTTEHLRKIERNPHSVAPHLKEQVRALARKYRFFHWHIEFPAVFGPEGGRGFDVILGNPPWIRQELLKTDKPLLVVFKSFVSTADSSVYFLERSSSITRAGGRVAMLTPNKWFRASYAANLRKVLREKCRFHLLIDFGHSRNLFPDVDTFPAAVTFEPIASPAADAETALSVRAHDSDRARHSLQQLIRDHAIEIRHGDLSPERWQLEASAASDLLSRLMETGQPLELLLPRPIFRGLLTGFNQAFYVETALRDMLVAADPTSGVLFKQFLRGRDVKRWLPRWNSQWHIVIPSSQNRLWPWSTADEREAEAIFAETYPSVHAHLKQFEQPLRKRQDKGQYWWELRACDYYEDFEKPKIIVQCIAYYSQFAFDDAGHYVNNKAIVIPTDDLYVLAILNSRVMWWIVNRTFQHMKDEGLSVDVQFLKRLPVPVVDKSIHAQIEATARELIHSDRTPGQSPASLLSLETQLNELVLDAFQLTGAERQAMVMSLPPRDPVAVCENGVVAESSSVRTPPTGSTARSALMMQIYDAMQHAIDTGKPYQTRLEPPPADPGVAHPTRGKEGEGHAVF